MKESQEQKNVTPTLAKIPGGKVFLYLTEFFAGMSVMAVELGASRLLAPYFSSSQIVWTIIIGTIMIAMALGNLYGGRMADKKPDPAALYRRIVIAAIWIAAIPVLGKYVIVGVAGIMVIAVNTGFLIWAAFAACMVVFVFPLFLLGTVTPCLVKYAVQNLEDSGSTVGKLNASNTIGSIIGTFVPTFRRNKHNLHHFLLHSYGSCGRIFCGDKAGKGHFGCGDSYHHPLRLFGI